MPEIENSVFLLPPVLYTSPDNGSGQKFAVKNTFLSTTEAHWTWELILPLSELPSGMMQPVPTQPTSRCSLPYDLAQSRGQLWWEGFHLLN